MILTELILKNGRWKGYQYIILSELQFVYFRRTVLNRRKKTCDKVILIYDDRPGINMKRNVIDEYLKE